MFCNIFGKFSTKDCTCRVPIKRIRTFFRKNDRFVLFSGISLEKIHGMFFPISFAHGFALKICFEFSLGNFTTIMSKHFNGLIGGTREDIQEMSVKKCVL